MDENYDTFDGYFIASIYIYIEREGGRVYSVASYKISYSVTTSIYDNFIY
jgi:hypothetical protein